MSAPQKLKYRTTNWKDHKAALKARGSLLIWLDKNMCRHGSASGKRGRSRKYSESAIQFCLTIKSLFNLAPRRAMGMAQSLLKLAGLDWEVLDFSTASRRQKHLAVTIGAHPTTGLHLLVDSTGIKMLGEGEWKTKKHGADYRRQWRKVHLRIDASTLEIRAIKVTDNATGDAPSCRVRSTRSPMTKSSPALVVTAPTTRRAVMRPLHSEGHKRSSRHAKLRSRGRIDVRAPLPATPYWTRRAGLAGQYGKSGLAIIDAASLKPKCVASSCSVNG